MLHDGRPCSWYNVEGFTPCDFTASPPLHLSGGADIDLGDLQLPEVGQVIASVDVLGGQGHLELYDLSGKLRRRNRVYGNYPNRISQVQAGTYRLVYKGPPTEGSEVYPDLDCLPAACDPAAGQPVVVGPGQVVEGIKFTPEGLPNGCNDWEGCLNEERFRVAVRWRDPAGQTGNATRRPISDLPGPDSAFYWFFSQDNTELVVKVLDACDLYDRFWVFAAGSTDVGVEIEVEDTATGELKHYHHAVGAPFQPLLDTDAFTCEGPAAVVVAGASAADGEKFVATPSPAWVPPANTSVCDSNTEANRVSLCLLENRFRVDTKWWSFDGSEGGGRVYDHGVGALSFFDPDNVEVMMKVLDGCALNGHYWVFGTGLTNVGVRLLVTDTYTDRQKAYENPLGHPFEPILDTAAFTCWRE